MTRAKDKTNNRATVNVVSLIVTFCVLFVAITVSDGSFANSIDKISRNLDVALEDLKDDMPNYTDYREGDRTFAKITFNPKGMAGLYNLTIKIMDWMLDKDAVVKDLLNMNDPKHPQLNSKVHAVDLLRFYWPILLLVLVLALMAALLPLCGFCVCCCRCCCGNCGGRARPCDKRRDLCRKVMLGTVLIVLGTALLFCVVCAFASNEQLSGGIEELPDNLNISRSTASHYLDSTDKQLDHLLITNFNEFSYQFLKTLGKSGDYIMQDLNHVSHALALINLKTFVDSLPLIKKSTEKLKTSTNSLRVYASQLNDAMRKVKRDLLVTLHKCQQVKACEELLNKINNLKTNIDFDKLPDITPLINNLDELPNDALNTAVTEGKHRLDTIENNIKRHLEDALKNVRGRIVETNNTIQKDLDQVKDALKSVQDLMLNKTEPHLKDLRTYIKQYNRHIYYVGFSMGIILLLVATGITFGLVCGICGKRPDGYNDNCCNKGVGSQFLMCSVAIMFLFGFFISSVAFSYFMLGFPMNRVLCYPLRHPDRSTLLAYVDKYVQSNMEQDLDVNVTYVLEHCYHNQSIYNVLNLKNKFNIDELAKKADISKYLDDMQNSVSDIIPKDFKILSDQNKEVLKDLGERELSINFEQFENELNASFTNLNLKDISKQLGDIADRVPDDEIVKEVKLSILHIDTYDEKLLTPMNDISGEMIQTAHELYDHLRMGAENFQTAVKNLTDSITEAEITLNKRGPALIKKVISDFGNVIQNQVKSYVDRLTHIAKHELGQCGVLSLAINQTLTATCDKIVMPINGFWVTLVLSLLLFIPTIIVSIKLANLYQRYKPNGHYVETEYLYDAYADRDNIPLNSRGGHKRGKKKPKKGKKYEERPPNMGGEVVTREYAAGSHPPDSRYGDMAPKHWEDFPNGGPPQYQRAPTEYERPPPYYYPATGDQ